MDDETVRLRREQAARVMPLVGQLLDLWDETSNDVKDEIEDHAPELHDVIVRLLAATEDSDE